MEIQEVLKVKVNLNQGSQVGMEENPEGVWNVWNLQE